jgi:outer membrane protein
MQSYKMKKIFLIITLIVSQLKTLSAQRSFENLDAILAYANSKSIGIQSNDIRLLQAKKTKLAAKLAIADPMANINGNFTNNTRLPVNLFPAEIFGGQKGEFREVQTGVQYNTTSSQNLDVKLLNLEGWKNYKLADINIQISETDSRLNFKSLQENIASVYYNIVQLNAQLESTKQNLLVADTLLQVAQNKYKQGIVKQQDVNDSKVNQLTIKENIKQIEYLINQNYISLKILADIPELENIEITETIVANNSISKPIVQFNDLLVRSNLLKEEYALGYIEKTKKAITPTISFVASNSFNQFNNDFSFFQGNWITSNYVGLKLNFALPNANTITNKTKAYFDYELAKKSTLQAQIKADLNTKQLSNDFEKAISQQHSNSQILEIQRDTYEKNKNLYTSGLIGIDRTLGSLNAMLNANYNLISSKVNVLLAQSKIDINNKIK